MKGTTIEKILLLHESIVEMLYEITEQPETDAPTLTRLSKLHEETVLAGVSMHPNTPKRSIRKNARKALWR